MEDLKPTESSPPSGRRYKPWREKTGRWILALLAAVVIVKSWIDFVPVEKRRDPDPSSTVTFRWEEVQPSETLYYYDCGNGFQCARLEVPMDYECLESQARQFVLAIVKVPAKVPVGDPRYGGAMLINPGGPGGSGALQALLSGRHLQTIVDAENDPSSGLGGPDDKYFDIIGFDPRGVGQTTPAVTCFPDSTSQRNWELAVEAEGLIGSSEDALRRSWQRTQALNLGCSVHEMNDIQQNASMMAYVNTPLVARDMLTIVERHGEWREREGLKAQEAHDSCHGYDTTRSIAKRTEWREGQEPLLYWGRSYGTVLGTTFAALFPDRVSRAVLDGVVNMDKYYEDRGPSVIIDADAIFDRFGLYCDAVGPDECPFFVVGGSSAIQDAYWTLENQILNSSIPVMASATRGPEVITWTDVKAILRIAVYQPLLAFPVLAEKIGALANGNPVPMADFKRGRHFSTCPSNECSMMGPWSPQCTQGQDNTLYAMSAILCTDAEFLVDKTLESFAEMWMDLKADSQTLGDYWAQMLLSCAGWKAKAKYKFTGPWDGIVTSHPMLFVSNTLDPVTPLYNAQHMSDKFPGSALLQQDSEGHTTLAAPSMCIAKLIRTYFQTGDLPDVGTLCLADLKPMVGHVDQMPITTQSMTAADRKLFDALIAETKQGYLAL
ncbi:Peptidase S33 tripeptidyl aminopeptidase-like C-terminal [Penicillium pulvis]|uniref:Peptidase S33 tripeptidyl aminopeptidase-like C-terminal n=1 Tax=Penicillium pulvis TaxID=1562058 RepID=UPI0025496998|nr:Peptidase S33 tripeptidyl aminopeptidase-like C-terminal [Penicillium pulvis]KAJ5786225.1 Peptidase S33 tripeptidyl aminopeptidase-like C-terminal [Penicillium pulvis]